MQETKLDNPLNYLRVFTQRKLLIIIITAITAGASVAFARFSEPVYTATATMIIAFRDPSNTNTVLPAMLQEDFMATQIGIISSKFMAESVLASMDIDNNVKFKSIQERFSQYTESERGQRAAIARWILNHLRVYVHNKSTRLIKIAFRNEDRTLAVDVANAFSQQYLETALNLNLAPIRSSAKWIEENVRPIRSVLGEAEGMLKEGYSEEVIDKIESLLDTARNDLNTLMVMLNQRSAYESNSQYLQEVRSAILNKNQVLIEKSKVLGARNNEYLALQSEVKYLKDVFISEVRKQIESIRVAMASLNNSLVLRSSVTQSNVTLLNPADVDVESDSVSVKKALLYGMVLGFMLGVIVAFFSLLGRTQPGV